MTKSKNYTNLGGQKRLEKCSKNIKYLASWYTVWPPKITYKCTQNQALKCLSSKIGGIKKNKCQKAYKVCKPNTYNKLPHTYICT